MPGVSGAGRSAIELLRAGLPVVVVARGGSMWPLVRSGDRLTIEPGRAVGRGSLVAYLRNGRLTVHRARDVTRAWVVVRGDAATFDEPPLPIADVLGVVSRQVTVRGTRVDHLSAALRLFDGAFVRAQPLLVGVLRRGRAWRASGEPLAQSDAEGGDGPVGEDEVQDPAGR